MSRSPSGTGASAAPFPIAHHRTSARLGGTPAGRSRSLRGLIVAASACAGSGLLIAACAGPASHNSAGQAAAPRPAIVNGPANRVHAQSFSGSAGGRAAAPPSASDLAKLALSQDIIYTANLTLRVKDVGGTAAQATSDVIAAGGYVADEQQIQPSGPGAAGEIDLTFKIPVPAYHQTLASLTKLGRRLMFNEQAQDVTQQVADVTSRAASAQAAIRQLRQLLSRAGDVGQLLQVQDEINTQESALESLIAQQQALARETAYATVNLSLLGHHAVVVRKKHKKPASHGLIAGLGTGWRALKLVVVWVLTALGTLLPFAAPIAAIGAIVYFGRRKATRRRTPPAPAPAPPPATS